MLTSWLTSLISKSALELESHGRTLFQFGVRIERALSERPIQEWEADRWARGLKQRLIKMEQYFFRVGTGKGGCLSFFVRNDRGVYVGFRRESITQAATYVSLITDYGYPRISTRFETGWMDVAVFDRGSKALIYAENKSHAGTLDKLCRRLENDFRQTVPFTAETDKVTDDALMKAQHLWRHRPRYFWAVCPTGRRSYTVEYSVQGFTLAPTEDMPTAHHGGF
jgi:hypothetical protein